MSRSSVEILDAARKEIARGRPRAALRELALARSELLASADLDGLKELLELARGIRTLAPADTKARERLLAETEAGIETLAPGATAGIAATSTEPQASFTPYGLVSTEQILAPARAEIERRKTGRALRLLEKARRKLLTRADVDGLGELIELASRVPADKPRHVARRKRLLDAAQQNIRYLSRRKAIKAGETWSDPFVAGKPKTRLPSLPPMSRREKLIAAAIVVALAGGITALALLDRAPQRVAHAIKCPTGKQGGPTWSPDGKEIAFAKNGDCGTQIVAVSSEGGPLRTITSRFGELPDWSPDGRTILYRSRDGFSVIPAGGGKSHLIRSDDGNLGASWSPDGTRIAFVHGLTGNQTLGFHSTLYTMKPDGSDLRRLLGHSCNPRTPAWSPKGGYLVFACDDGIYVMRSKSGSPERVVVLKFSVWPISVSTAEDPSSIAFGWDGVETCSVNGNDNPKVLTNGYGWADGAIDVAWSPGGKRIAFSVTGSGSGDGLYVIDRNGRHRRRLVGF